jgi:hypothetical protein
MQGRTVNTNLIDMIVALSLLGSGCYYTPGQVTVDNSVGTPALTTASISHNLLVIQGNNLHKVNKIKLTGNGQSVNFILNTQDLMNLSATAASALALTAGALYNLVLTNANGDTTFPISMTADTPDPYFTAPSLYYRSINNSGIGTTYPIERLDVTGDIRIGGQATTHQGTTTAQAMLSLYNYNYGIAKFTATGSTDPGVRVFSNTGTDIQFGLIYPSTPWPYSGGGFPYLVTEANFQPKMVIASGGDVGIGTTTPGYQLTLAGVSAAFGVDNTAIFSARNASATYEQYLWPRWSDNIMYMNYGSSGFNIRNNSSTSTMFMTNAGNVGIGTTTPGYTLDVSGSGRFTSSSSAFPIMMSSTNSGSQSNVLFISSNSTNSITEFAMGTSQTTNNAAEFQFNSATGTGNAANFLGLGVWGNASKLVITGSGNVGIGITNPAYTLDLTGNEHITGGLKIDGTLPDNLATGTNVYYNNNGNANWNLSAAAYGSTNTWSIWAGSRIAASEIWVKSDARIKTQVEPLNTSESLNLLRQLCPKKYQYIDYLSKGTSPRYGFIAQELEKVLPTAVNTNPSGEYVPNIFELAKITPGIQQGSLISLKTKKIPFSMPNDGRKVKIKAIKNNNQTIELTLNAIENSHSFWVEETLDDDKLFIYGSEVDDFKTVDYNDTLMITISALQALDSQLQASLEVQTQKDRRLQALESVNAAIRLENTAIKQDNATLKTAHCRHFPDDPECSAERIKITQ